MNKSIYPSKTDYHNALQHPQIAFKNLDPSLEKGHAIKRNNGHGLWIASGQFACVFKFKTNSPQKLWAIRCPTQCISNTAQHYRKVHDCLTKISQSSAYFVDFQFLDQGIRVNGNIYPIIKMEWSEGVTLNTFIEQNLNNKNKLESLAKCWLELCNKLIADKIAHGDLQHGNILVLDNNNNVSIKLVDYDSLYYEPEDKNNTSDEIKGLNGYQHPLRDKIKNQSLKIDYFSQIVIYLSIIALAEKPQLWEDYKCYGADRLLFRRDNFEHPDDTNKSKIFTELATLSDNVSKLAQELKNLCKLTDFDQIPSLEDVLKTINPVATQVSQSIDGTRFFIAQATQRNQVNTTTTTNTQNQNPATNVSTQTSQSTNTNDATGFFVSQTQIPNTTNILQNEISDLRCEIIRLNQKITKLNNENSNLIKNLNTNKLLINVLVCISLILGVVCFYQNSEIKELKEQIGNLHS